jgi:hypothetical protein
MKRAAIHWRKREPITTPEMLELQAQIDRALACNFPPGYVAQGIGRSTAAISEHAQANRSRYAAEGIGWGDGTIRGLSKNTPQRAPGEGQA